MNNCNNNFDFNDELICPETVVNNMNKNEKIFFVLNNIEYYFNKNEIFFKEKGEYKLIFEKTDDNIIEIGLEFFRKYPIEIKIKKYQFNIYSNKGTNSQFSINNNIDNL